MFPAWTDRKDRSKEETSTVQGQGDLEPRGVLACSSGLARLGPASACTAIMVRDATVMFMRTVVSSDIDSLHSNLKIVRFSHASTGLNVYMLCNRPTFFSSSLKRLHWTTLSSLDDLVARPRNVVPRTRPLAERDLMSMLDG